MTKYSILIPCFNGLPFIRSAIQTVLIQNYQNFEIVVSDDHSSDGSYEELIKISDKRITIIKTDRKMSMSEHWEYLLDFAKGDWIMFLGQDDGLQPYFFNLLEELTDIAKEKKLKIISSKRAYFFWPGVQNIYGDISLSYSAKQSFSIKIFWPRILKALLWDDSYFNLPAMYTSSLFHKSLIKEGKIKLGGRVFVSHPQDANLAALASSLEKKYLYTQIPLGWVGTSPKSAGLAVTKNGLRMIDSNTSRVASVYLEKISNSRITYDPRAGDFQLGSGAVYFWQSLLKTNKLRGKIFDKFLSGKFLFTWMIASVLSKNLLLLKSEYKNKKIYFNEILDINKISKTRILIPVILYFFLRTLVHLVYINWRIFDKINSFINQNYYQKRIKILINKEYLDVIQANSIVAEKVKEKEKWGLKF